MFPRGLKSRSVDRANFYLASLFDLLDIDASSADGHRIGIIHIIGYYYSTVIVDDGIVAGSNDLHPELVDASAATCYEDLGAFSDENVYAICESNRIFDPRYCSEAR